jgi:hypothetical protein
MGSVGHEDLLWLEPVPRQLHSTGEVFTHLRHQTVSSHDLDQRAWTSHLASIFRVVVAEYGA